MASKVHFTSFRCPGKESLVQKFRRLVLTGAAGLVPRTPSMKPLATWRFAKTAAELEQVQRENAGAKST